MEAIGYMVWRGWDIFTKLATLHPTKSQKTSNEGEKKRSKKVSPHPSPNEEEEEEEEEE
jgi:hypothetical protein